MVAYRYVTSGLFFGQIIMLKIILTMVLKISKSWKYGILSLLIAGLLSWHYGSVYFSKKAGKAEQKQETVDAINVLVDNQEKQNEKDNADVDTTDVDIIRAGLLKHSRPSSSTMPTRTSTYKLQYRGSRGDGRSSCEGYRKTPQSMEGAYQELCRQTGCEADCNSINFDKDFGLIGDCNDLDE